MDRLLAARREPQSPPRADADVLDDIAAIIIRWRGCFHCA